MVALASTRNTDHHDKLTDQQQLIKAILAARGDCVELHVVEETTNQEAERELAMWDRMSDELSAEIGWE